jgi:predicted ATPase/DNA-binding winged helix-turn-helix (wHTH) protein/class 3 adenylate cyclase
LAADATGYSRLMAIDDRATVTALDAAREVFSKDILANGGRVVDMAGDSVMSVFDTATGAMNAALSIQRRLAASARCVPEDSRILFRIGVHIGDVIEKDDGTVYGDGVNIAARLEGLAEPGAVALSHAVHGIVARRVDAVFEDIGAHSVKNITEPVRAYRAKPREPRDIFPGRMARRYFFDRFEVREIERQLLVEGAAVHLGARAIEVLLALLQERDRLLTKRELLDRIWLALGVKENNLATQISTLRRVLGAQSIVTAQGLGYRLGLPVVEQPAEPLLQAGPLAAEDGAASAGSQVFGALEWQPLKRAVLVDGQPIELDARAYDLLAVLIQERRRIVSKQELLERAWPDLVVEEDSLQLQVSTLRGLLGPQAITTVPGRGYRFTLEGETAASGVVSKSREARATNLPVAAEALIGRAADVDALGRMLDSSRLVTVLGAGGIGKTRLCQVLARDRLADFEHGVWWVDLGVLSVEADIVPAIAAAASLQLGNGDPAAQLAQALDGCFMLLVLDNCEHLAAAVSRLVELLQSNSEGVRLLATSQVPLRAAGEQLFRIEPLSIPSADLSIEQARAYGALLLLERRAQAVDRHFVISQDALPAAIALCRELDGLPLAIEMAASRLPLIGMEALCVALRERLRWMKNNLRQAPARQQTLSATLDWSHSLLSGREQAVLRRLSVFSGSFSLKMAQRVAATHDIDPWDVLEAMGELTERSLLQADSQESPHYRLLESTRAYAIDRLTEHGEEGAARTAHMALMAEIGNEAEQAYWTTPDDPWLEVYAPLYEDLQSAFLTACESGDADAAAGTLGALFHTDELRESSTAMPARLLAAWALSHEKSPQAAARISCCCASLFSLQMVLGGISKLECARRALEVWRQPGDERRRFQCLLALSWHAECAGHHEEAAAALRDAAMLENPAWPARLRWLRALHESKYWLQRGDSALAIQRVRDELRFAELAGSACQAANAHTNLADVFLISGNFADAIEVGRDVVARAGEVGRPMRLALAMLNLTAALVVARDLEGARALAEQTLPGAWRYFAGPMVDHVASLGAQLGLHAEAALLLGWADSWYGQRQWTRERNEAAAADTALLLCSAALSVAEVQRLRDDGARLADVAARRLAEASVSSPARLQRSA